jgi:ribonuclease BN (tRNA processing enzyme)
MRCTYRVDELILVKEEEDATSCQAGVNDGPLLSYEEPGVSVLATKTRTKKSDDDDDDDDDDITWKVPHRMMNCIDPEQDVEEETNVEMFEVYAAALRHSLEPCFGFVLQERTYPGRVVAPPKTMMQSLDVQTRVETNHDSRKSHEAFRTDEEAQRQRPLCRSTSALHRGPRRKGRRITILGDTCDSRAIAAMAVGSDLLVHECTNAFIESPSSSLMDPLHTTKDEVHARTYAHGHSTPSMASQFAHAIRCEKLLLTHFSRRYRDDDSADMLATMDNIKTQCRVYFDKEIHCAHDLQHFKVPLVENRWQPSEDHAMAAAARAAAAAAANAAKEAAQMFFATHPYHVDGQTAHGRRLLGSSSQ